ncbi:hypothetical protein HAX54_001747 [Datura stramonium]|uniref:Uncharacterized protein n=1 Tax=Datura stramonium TaxID=4076 RepID=A0ABS8RUB1_DATST|nr:hypothetical protein [Datura stramonium]
MQHNSKFLKMHAKRSRGEYALQQRTILYPFACETCLQLVYLHSQVFLVQALAGFNKTIKHLDDHLVDISTNDPLGQSEKVQRSTTSSAVSSTAAVSQLDKKLETLPEMIAGVWSDDSSLQLECTTQFRKLLSIVWNLVPRFVEFLSRDDYPQLQFEAAWALTNIASGTLLSSPSDDVREQAVWALGNIAGDSPKYRDLVLGHGALVSLLAQFAVIEAGSVSRLVELLLHSSPSVLIPALLFIGNIVTGDDIQTQVMIDHHALPCLLNLLTQSTKKALKRKLAGQSRTSQLVIEIKFRWEADKDLGNTEGVNVYAQLIDEAEGLEKIENLQSHDNTEIYEKAVKILETYWLEEEDEQLPSADAQHSGFNFGEVIYLFHLEDSTSVDGSLASRSVSDFKLEKRPL